MSLQKSIPLALLCLLASGCVSQSGLSLNPFAKNQQSNLGTPKKPLTQFALDALKPKKKEDVKIVSPMDWFRGKTNDPVKDISAAQLANLTQKYNAAQQSVANKASQIASPITQPLAKSPVANLPLLGMGRGNTGGLRMPSQASVPVTPQYVAQTYANNGANISPFANARRAISQVAAKFPTVQLQSAQIPDGQTTTEQVTTAQYPSPNVPQTNGANAFSTAQGFVPQTMSPPTSGKMADQIGTGMAQYGEKYPLPQYPSTQASQPAVTKGSKSTQNVTPSYPTTNYPSTAHPALPSTATGPSSLPTTTSQYPVAY